MNFVRPAFLAGCALLAAAAAEARTLTVFVVTGETNALGAPGTSASTMTRPAPGTRQAETGMHVPFFWDNRLDATTDGDTALGASGGWIDLGTQTGGAITDNPSHWGPEIGFARVLWDAGVRDFAIVKAATGNAGNTAWAKGDANGYAYAHLVATVQAATAKLPADYDAVEIAGLIYLQGESNSADEAAAAGTRFTTLLADLRTDLPSAATMKAIVGTIGGTSTDRTTTAANLKAVADASADIGYVANTRTALVDATRYNADSLVLLGERFAGEAIDIGCFAATPLPAWASLQAWYLGDKGTTLSSTGGTVTAWCNLARGNAANHDLNRVNGAPAPRTIYTTGMVERAAMGFGGTSNIWSAASDFGTLSASRTVLAYVRVRANSTAFLFDGSTGTGLTRAMTTGGNWAAGVAAGGGFAATETTTLPLDTSEWQAHAFVYEPDLPATGQTTCTHYLRKGDGTLTQAAVIDTAKANLGGFIVGANGAAGSMMNVDVGEIAIYSKALDSTEVATALAAMNARLGQPVYAPPGIAASQPVSSIPRFGWHPLLRISASDDTGTSTLSQLVITLKPGTRQHIARIALLASGTSSTYRPEGTWIDTQSKPATDQVTFNLSRPLSSEGQYLWVVIEPERHSPLGSILDASVASAAFADPATVPTLISPDPTGALVLDLVPLAVDVRRSGQDGVNTYRIPGMVCDKRGWLHAVYDLRWNGGGDLPANIDVGHSRSTDGGATWEPMNVVLDFDKTVANSSGNGVGDPAILYDEETDTLWAAGLWSFGNRGYAGSGQGLEPSETGQFVLAKSTDGGATWSGPINITKQIKDPVWYLLFQGPGHGFVLRDGTLIFPSQTLLTAGGNAHSGFIYSKDKGETWKFGSYVPSTTPTTNEVQTCELDDGRLLFSMRTPSGSNGQRAFATYTRGGAVPEQNGTWSTLWRTAAVPDPVCQGSLIQWTSRTKGHPRGWSIAGNAMSGRTNITLRLTADGGQTWPVQRQAYTGASAYSDLAVLPDGSLGLLFEADSYTRILFLRMEPAWIFNPAVDTDADGMPDSWETLHGLDPASAADASADPDHDGTTNLMEWKAGTDPQAGDSVLKATGIERGATESTFTWASVPQRAYAVESSTDLESWTPVPGLESVRASAASCTITLPDSPAETSVFYRVRALE